MSKIPLPSEENHYLSQHVGLMLHSYRHWLKRPLLGPMNELDAARYLFHAPFAVVSHNTAKEPIFNYANQTAMNLFAMSWEDITALPSCKSAEAVAQADRQHALDRVESQ
ncbi:MAG: MEKHLA domain-containing protein, partial [Candidatus Methylumidiphilus sp.]